jgi:ribosome biogenesis GTPase A
MKNRSESTSPALTDSNPINWFPGHMAKAMRLALTKVSKVDAMLEVRDARLPLTSGNSMLHEKLASKPRLIVLNKTDLADPENVGFWTDWLKRRGEPFIFISSGDRRSLRHLLVMARELGGRKRRKMVAKGIRSPPLRLMVIGIPNTGKSSLINRLIGRRAVPTGNRPGVTRGESWLVLNQDLELLDTPGIMPPRIETEEQGLGLCAIHAIKDEIVGQERVARFVATKLLKQHTAAFRQRYALSELDIEDQDVIEMIGKRLHFMKKGGEVDLAKTCVQLLTEFRSGALGTCCFEYPPDHPGQV